MKVKKILELIVTALIAGCIAVGISGCKKEIELPPMTETAPVAVENCLSLLNSYKQLSKYDYNGFVDYYNGSFKEIYNGKFYYLNTNIVEPEERLEVSINALDGVSILVQKNSDIQQNLVEPIIYEGIRVKDKKAGIVSPGFGVAPMTIGFDICFIPVVEGTENNELTLKYGALTHGEHTDHYINIYKGNICIGTAYFSARVSLTNEWFEDFFTRHLIYGG